MKLYTFRLKDRTLLGVEKNGSLLDITPQVGSADMTELISNFENVKPEIKEVLDNSSNLISFKDVKILCPVRSSIIMCSGLNYKTHEKENPNAKFLDAPRYFAKLPNTVIGPDEPILHPGENYQVDWEVEFAVVFQKGAYHLSQKNAMDHVFGYTILHDVSSRYIQFKDNNEMMGKNFNSFCPIGPCIVTKDEIPEPEKCNLSLKVNGVYKQNGTNQDWCFTLPRLIEWLTMAIPMGAGDIRSTGTPQGIGFFRDPKEFLKPGDICELEISGIGKLINPVQAARK
ncbi:MAG: fumarylacetoacetate hydrolase family protein [Cyclobacteriaceae bacterium]